MRPAMIEREILEATERSIGMLYLSRIPDEAQPDGWIYTVHIDGAMLMSSESPLSERELSTRGIAAHPGKQLRVLIGGLGLGYTAEAAVLSERSALVRVVEGMDFVNDWMRSGKLPLSKLLTTDPRVELVLGDVYAQLLGPPTDEKWDLILVDVDHAPKMPLSPDSLPFYTAEGQAAVQQHLAPGGILGVWSAFDDDDFAAVMAAAYPESWREEIEWQVAWGTPNEMLLNNTLFYGRCPSD